MASITGRGVRGTPPLAAQARALSARERLFPKGCRALIMVSGGQDSTALLHLLATRGLGEAGPTSLHALHVNHHVRGTESDDDEALVTRICAELGVALSVVHRPVSKKAGSVQEAAREARREAALEQAGAAAATRIVLGHTADDQVETMLYRLGRYGGLAAFRGMLPCDPPWVRPLLECRRADTAAYCEAVGLEYARDRGNTDPGYARTAIREQVVPAWERALPGAVAAATRSAEVAAEMQALAEGIVAETWGRVAVAACAHTLSVSGLLGLEATQRRLLLHAWLEGGARPGASRASVLAVEGLLHVPGSATRALGGGWCVRKEYDRLWLERARRRSGAAAASEGAGGDEDEAPAPRPLSIPGEVRWGGTVVKATPAPGTPAARFQAPDVSHEAFVDARCLAGAVEVRGPLPGDRVHPLGAAGSRKLQDVFVDRKVPRTRRRSVPLVVCDGRVVWVCGLVVAEEGRITAETTDIVRLEVRADDEEGGQA